MKPTWLVLVIRGYLFEYRRLLQVVNLDFIFIDHFQVPVKCLIFPDRSKCHTILVRHKLYFGLILTGLLVKALHRFDNRGSR